MEEEEESSIYVKVILLGESGVGKTSLINVAVGIDYTDILNITASPTFVTKKFNKFNKEYILNIWDTAGQEKFRAMTKLFIKDAKIAILVYAIDDKKSFECLSFWALTVKEILGEEVILALVGNKSDLYLKEEIKAEVANDYAKSLNAKFKIVSAKLNPRIFISFLEELLDDYLEKNEEMPKRESFEIKKEKYKKKKK